MMMQTTQETPHFNFDANRRTVNVMAGPREKRSTDRRQDLNLVDLMLSLLPAEI